MTVRIITGHVLDCLAQLPDESVHCVVTSPPYYGLRDYGIEPQVWHCVEPMRAHLQRICSHEWGDERIIATGNAPSNKSTLTTNGGKGPLPGDKYQHENTGKASTGAFCRHCNAWRGDLGLEPTLELYLEHMVEIMREVRRVLRKDGTCWLNIGDSYNNNRSQMGPGQAVHGRDQLRGKPEPLSRRRGNVGFKEKDLMLIPSRLAIRLQEDGWWVRSEIVWAKKAPMPESCTDRPTCAHEKVFLLTKSAHYFYDAEAVKEESIDPPGKSRGGSLSRFGRDEQLIAGNAHRGNEEYSSSGSRNLRNFWLLGPESFPEAHFATFPTEIPRRAIRAGSLPGGTILDPFLGAGTTALVADQLGRDCIGIELNSQYAAMAESRLRDDAGMFAQMAAE